MKLRCKAGDLAIVVRDEPGCEDNIGRVVQVSGPIVVRPVVGPTWLIRPIGAQRWQVYRPHLARPVETATTDDRLSDIEHPDGWLLPLQQGGLEVVEAGVAANDDAVATGDGKCPVERPQ